MGYEIKLIIGKASEGSNEIERDMSKPYSDGSGFEYKKDANGEYVTTGRMERYFQVYAEIDLCKIGYEDKPLNALSAKSHKGPEKEVYYFFGTTEGNKDGREDRYGERLYPIPAEEVLAALKDAQEREGSEPYRRFKWAIALLESMVDDNEGIQVLFWGH